MATNLAQARRNRYGARNTNDGAAEDSPSQYYNANGSRSGARINGAVRRKTMMGGSTSGPISMRANRSESMEQEADAAKERDYRRGVERARWERNETAKAVHGSRAGNGYDVPAGGVGNQPAGRLIPGSAPGSSIWVKNGDPRLKKPESGSSEATALGGRALIAARRSRQAGINLKASQDRKFSQFRAEVERNPGTYAMEKQVSRVGTKQNNYDGMAKAREEARKRGELNPPPAVQY